MAVEGGVAGVMEVGGGGFGKFIMAYIRSIDLQLRRGRKLHPRHYIDARALGEIKSSYSGQRCSPGPAVIGGRSCFGGVMRRSLYVPKARNGRSPVTG